jgi:hypothetical protein
LLTRFPSADLQPGDSGVWVFDEATHELYGHIVASDIFGRAYVIPFEDVFDDIRDSLGAEAVSLPDRDEIAAMDQTRTSLCTPPLNKVPNQIPLPTFDVAMTSRLVTLPLNFEFPPFDHSYPGHLLHSRIPNQPYTPIELPKPLDDGQDDFGFGPERANSMPLPSQDGTTDSGYVTMYSSPAPAHEKSHACG